MPSIKWHYLPLSYFMLASLLCIWHTLNWHREAQQHICHGGRWVWRWWLRNYDPRTGRLGDFFGVSSKWLESEFLPWAAAWEMIAMLIKGFLDERCKWVPNRNVRVNISQEMLRLCLCWKTRLLKCCPLNFLWESGFPPGRTMLLLRPRYHSA